MDPVIAIIRLLLNHKYKLMLVPLLTMVAIFVITKNTPKKYKTDSKLYLNLQENKGLSLSDEDLKQYQIHTYFQNTIELLKSKKVIDKVRLKVIEYALADDNYFALGNDYLVKHKAEFEQRVAEWKLGKELNEQQQPDQAILQYLNGHGLSQASMKEMIVSFRIMDSNFMKLELTDSHPEKARLLATLFIESLIEENQALAKSKIKGHKDIIEELVRQAHADLDLKIKSLEQFKISNTIINLGEHTKAIVVYLVQLEGQRATLLSKIAAAHAGRTEVIHTVKDGNELTLDLTHHVEIVALKKELREINRLTAESAFRQQAVPEVSVIDRQIEIKKAEILNKISELARKTPYDPSQVQLDLAGRYLDYDLDAETAEDMVNVINHEIQRVMQYAKRFAPFESTIGAYEQEISTAQNVYLTLLNKLSLTQSMEFGSGENVIEIIDAPYLPIKPEPSKRAILIVAGGVSVFVLMAGVMIVLHLLNASIDSVEKFERLSTLPVLAAIPRDKIHATDTYRQTVNLIQHQQLARVAHTILSKCSAEENVLLLVSNQKEEGAHTFALALQHLFTQAEKSVAFIDADWLNDSACESFLDWRKLASPAGQISQTEDVQQKVSNLKRKHDLVVIITAPLNLTVSLDFWKFASHYVLHVFKAERVVSAVDKRIEAKLQGTDVHLLGTVIQNLPVENMEDYLGEVPLERSSLRRKMKNLIKRNFKK